MTRKPVVTGASSEIGLAICRRLLQAGDDALLQAFRHPERLEPIAGETGAACRVVAADLTDTRQMDELCRAAAGADLLVVAAAVTRSGMLTELDEADLSAMWQVNVTAAVRLCRAVLPGMVARRRGCIIFVTSVAAQRGNPGLSYYAGTKGFLESLARSLAAEYGRRGIRVNCVAPGPIEAGSLKELLVSADEEVREATALRRLGRAEDVASAVAYLAGEEAAFVTGQILRVDGGFLRGV